MPPAHYIATPALANEINNLPAAAEANLQEAQYLDTKLQNQIKLELLKTKRQFNKTLKQNNRQRKTYAGHIFKFTCFWAVLMFGIIVLQAFGVSRLADQVLITLITSTTINFFGFFLLVVRYLFNTEKREGEEQMNKE